MSRTLVAYFSASGETAALAKTVAEVTGGDLFEIRPETPYTAADLDWQDSHSRSTLEMKDEKSRPAIAGRVADMAQYDGEDLERLSTVMTLHDIGFTAEESETYMRLLLEQPDSEVKRLRMLEEKRRETLDAIHFQERQLQRLDYLRHEIQNQKKKRSEPS